MNKIVLTKEAQQNLNDLKNDPSKAKILKSVVKALNFMQINLRHSSLNTHEYYAFKGKNGEKIFEAYAHKELLMLIEYFGTKVQKKKL